MASILIDNLITAVPCIANHAIAARIDTSQPPPPLPPSVPSFQHLSLNVQPNIDTAHFRVPVLGNSAKQAFTVWRIIQLQR